MLCTLSGMLFSLFPGMSGSCMKLGKLGASIGKCGLSGSDVLQEVDEKRMSIDVCRIVTVTST
jgi:hypothetical protein